MLCENREQGKTLKNFEFEFEYESSIRIPLALFVLLEM